MISLTSSIEFQISLLLFVALAGYLLASRIHQSAVIGEIIVGIIIGPSVLGLITYTDFVRGIASMGAVVLLFVIGLEFKLKDIVNIKYGIVALCGVIVPWISGYYLAKLFGFDYASAVFVATALTATSIAITAQVLRELGKLKTEYANAIIGAAVIDDILGLLALSTSVGLVSGTFSYAFAMTIVAKSVIFLVAGYLIGTYVIKKIIMKTDEAKIARKYPEFVFIFAIMFAFLYAMIAELVGLSAILGAFVAGISLGEMVLSQSKNYKEGSEYLLIILASIFFVSLGILADFRALTWGIVLFLAVLTIVAVLTKVIGCGLPARLSGMSLKESAIVGVGMVPRGEVAMIVALIGLNQGILSQGLYVSLVLMSLITTMITPLLIKKLLNEPEKLQFKFKKKKVF